jgi:hypothetical protein
LTAVTDQTIPDEKWWYSDYAESEDFIGVGAARIRLLVANLKRNGESKFIINRLLHDNHMPYGLLNSAEYPNCRCYRGSRGIGQGRRFVTSLTALHGGRNTE